MRAAVPYLKIPPTGDPYLEGQACTSCGVIFLHVPHGCARCLSREGFTPTPLGVRGTLHTFTTVHRSFPGVKTPFHAAIVDMDSGAVVPGTLINAKTPTPGMPLQVVFADPGRTDKDGNTYLCHFFQPLTPKKTSPKETS